MRQCLTSIDGGYYTSSHPERDQFGQKGDFVTSPEISQIFGELIGLWVVAEWIAQGRKSEGVYLMEIGPGRGTLMDDMLRTIRNFKPLASAIKGIYLVEASPSLRKTQHTLLCGDNPLIETDIGYTSTSKHSDQLNIVWCDDIRFVPRQPDTSPFIIAHEFFDALPIHIFESVPPAPASTTPIQTPTGPIIPPASSASKHHQWRELLVSPTPPHATHQSLNTPKTQHHEPVPDFQLTRAKASTPHSLYLPETSPRYKALKNTTGAIIEISPESLSYVADLAVRIGGGDLPTENPLYTASKESITPSSPPSSSPTSIPPSSPPTSSASTSTSSKLTKHHPSGAALILDYGTPSTIPTNSLRGIRHHKPCSPLHSPGLVDLSADVDFLALAHAALDASPGVEVHGPVQQSRFLTAMGIQERAAALVKSQVDRVRGGLASGGGGGGGSGGEGKRKEELGEVVRRIEGGWKRLVDVGPQGMGRLYQVMAIVPHLPPSPSSSTDDKKKKTIRRPVGFGGDVEV